ncbi:MAG: thioredoxin domain-containing protein [Novosphingobium sp.]|nr:thioredoxin domain-containing protein [Novosphingobium sp.]
MTTIPFRRIAGLAAAALLLIAADAPAKRNWNAVVEVTPIGSHVIGNPRAKVKLIEYISYTCPHCAHFEAVAGDAMRIGWVGPGALSIEVRHLLRDPVDLTVAMLTNCGPPAKFPLNHQIFLRRQESWIALLGTATEAQQQRWSTGDNLSRMRAIASDFHFYELMEQRGYDRHEVERCLADEAMAKRLIAQTRQAASEGVDATPSFALDGVVLAGTHAWEQLEPQIKARL